MRKLMLPMAVVALVGCQPAGETGAMTEAVDVTPIISARTAAFAEAANAMNADSAAMFFAENATLMAPAMAPMQGREAIRAYFSQPSPIPNTVARLELRTEQVSSNGPLAVERGSYVWTATPAEGAPEGTPTVADSGSYLTHWHEINGTWLIVDDMWASRLAPAAEGESAEPSM